MSKSRWPTQTGGEGGEGEEGEGKGGIKGGRERK